MAKAVTAYADNKGKIHSNLKAAMEADDAYAAVDAWNYLLDKTVCPQGHYNSAVLYPTAAYLLKDRKLIEAVFAAVDKANRRTP